MMSAWPQDRVSNGGRLFRIELKEDWTDCSEDLDDNEDHAAVGALVFILGGDEVARIEPPDDKTPPRSDGQAVWTLSFPTYISSETSVLGLPDEPPIDNALFYIDMALDGVEDEGE